MIEINVSRQSELEDFAARLALLCDPKDVIALYGDLGAGKTVFSRAFIRSCGLPEEEVPSPTFTLVQMYDGETKNHPVLTVWHFDLYRLKSPEEIFEIGMEDAMYQGVCLIEWPERAEKLLPKKRLDIRILPAGSENARKLELTPRGKEWEEKLERIKK